MLAVGLATVTKASTFSTNPLSKESRQKTVWWRLFGATTSRVISSVLSQQLSTFLSAHFPAGAPIQCRALSIVAQNPSKLSAALVSNYS